MNPDGAVNAATRPAGWNAPLLLLLAGGILFFWRLGSHDLWPPDEPRFALVAREMLDRGDPVVLSMNHGLYTDKPPLFFWAIDGFALLRGGVDEWAARLPSAVAATLTLLLILGFGARIYDTRTGLLAALVFATSPQIAERARWASIDMTLDLFILGAIVLLWRARVRPDRARAAGRAAWILMGLATLAKGPVGVVLPLLAVLPAIMLETDWPALRRIVPPSGVLLYLAVTLAWLVPWAHRLGPGAALGVVWHQTAERYVDAWNGRNPVWYYLWQFPVNFAPWILFLPPAIVQAFGREERERRSTALFLTTWITAHFLFFSFSTGKRGLYIIPLYPAASLLVARLFARAAGKDGVLARRGLWPPLVLWAALAASLAVILPAVIARRYPDLVPAAAGIGALLLTGSVLALVFERRGRQSLVPWPLIGSMMAVLLLIVAVVVPWGERYQNLGRFASRLKEALRPGVPFGTTEQKREAWVFYTGRVVEALDTDAAVIDYMAQPPPRDLLIEEAKLKAVRDRLPGDVAEVLRGRVSGQDYFLLRRGASP